MIGRGLDPWPGGSSMPSNAVDISVPRRHRPHQRLTCWMWGISISGAPPRHVGPVPPAEGAAMDLAESAVDRPLPLDEFRRVLEACDRFEAALIAGQGPNVEDFLGDASGEERSVLLAELQALE